MICRREKGLPTPSLVIDIGMNVKRNGMMSENMWMKAEHWQYQPRGECRRRGVVWDQDYAFDSVSAECEVLEQYLGQLHGQ